MPVRGDGPGNPGPFNGHGARRRRPTKPPRAPAVLGGHGVELRVRLAAAVGTAEPCTSLRHAASRSTRVVPRPLGRRAGDRAIAAIDAAPPLDGFHAVAAVLAVIGDLTGVSRHDLDRAMPAHRTANDRLQLHLRLVQLPLAQSRACNGLRCKGRVADPWSSPMRGVKHPLAAYAGPLMAKPLRAPGFPGCGKASMNNRPWRALGGGPRSQRVARPPDIGTVLPRAPGRSGRLSRPARQPRQKFFVVSAVAGCAGRL